jgi:hypothetical protein
MVYCLARFEKNAKRWSTNLRTTRWKMLVALDSAGGNMEWDGEQKNIFLLADGIILKIDHTGAKRESVGFSREIVADAAATVAELMKPVR